MTPERIREIRSLAGENTDEFGQRFSRSGRTVEDWEQGRRNPDPLAIEALAKLEVAMQKKAKKGRKKAPQPSN
jgi:DNA-binding transcriptional regulator YiaG